MRYILLASIVSYLKQKHSEFNKKFFDNKLLSLPFKESTSKKEIGSFHPNINPQKGFFVFHKILDTNKEFADIVLLHEMCHQAQVELDNDIHPKFIPNDTDVIHGKSWQKWMKQCGLVPPERYKTADGFTGLDISNMSVNEILDAINDKKQETYNEKKKMQKRIELNEKYAMKELLDLVRPTLEKLVKAEKLRLDVVLNEQLHLMRQDFKKYIKMTEKIGLTVPEKIKLGYKHNWRLIMYKEVEKEVNNLKE